MSLTQFVRMPDVAARLKPLRPTLPRKITAPLKVLPRTDHYVLVGSAFDYLFRFELQRLAPHARAETWIADLAPDRLFRVSPSSPFGRSRRPEPETLQAINLETDVRQVLTNARAAVRNHQSTEAPSRDAMLELARHAIWLAHLDSVPRAGTLDPGFQQVAQADLEDL